MTPSATPKEIKIKVEGQNPVSAILEIPPKARALLVFAHGAGAGMRHATMTAIAKALHAHGVGTLRYQFPYMERGSKRPDSPAVAVAAVSAAVKAAAESAPRLPLFAGGKSFGGRMTTTAASLDQIEGVRGIVCFGFPLHPPKKPSVTRAEHLSKVRVPILFLQGTRDDLADLTLIRQVVKAHPKIELHVLEAADHGFAVLKSSGRTSAEVLLEVGEAVSGFCGAR